LASGQVVTSVRSVIKELVENSLDAKASTVEVRIHGVDKITVRDDGPGIDEDNMAMVCKRYCTSKLRGFDLSELTTMGFRGEALSSLCAVAEVTMTTRTAGESIARAYEFSSMGEILRQSTTAASIGTTVQVTKLFGNIPVRRQVIVK
ncbi:histidine kinase-like ATPase, partial [Cladochytrium replicatum]